MDAFQLSYGIRLEAKADELVCGDQYLIKELDDSVILVVADGLGHGEQAAIAANQAMKVLRESQKTSLIELVRECHQEITRTRGVVMTLVHIQNDFDVAWLGIGNVVGVHWSNAKKEILLVQGGIVGMNLPPLHLSTFKANRGDTLILATDGIQKEFIDMAPVAYLPPQSIANKIFEKYRNPNDDALVLTVRW